MVKTPDKFFLARSQLMILDFVADEFHLILGFLFVCEALITQYSLRYI